MLVCGFYEYGYLGCLGGELLDCVFGAVSRTRVLSFWESKCRTIRTLVVVLGIPSRCVRLCGFSRAGGWVSLGLMGSFEDRGAGAKLL